MTVVRSIVLFVGFIKCSTGRVTQKVSFCIKRAKMVLEFATQSLLPTGPACKKAQKGDLFWFLVRFFTVAEVLALHEAVRVSSALQNRFSRTVILVAVAVIFYADLIVVKRVKPRICLLNGPQPMP